MEKMAKRTMQEKVGEWNAKNLPGINVVVTEDDDTATRTTTRSEAYLLGGHTAVIMLEDRRGAYMLDRVKSENAPT